MAQEPENESGGKLDGVSLLYIVGGIPAMVVFFIVVFSLAHACSIPA